MIRQMLLMVVLISISACAATDGTRKPTKEAMQNQAIRDLIEVRGLEELEKIRTTERDGWKTLSESFVIYKTRRDRYLLEFARPCYEIRDNREITPDYRSHTRFMQAKFDTLRGCRIGHIYALTPAEAEEIENIGETPGSRN